MKEQRGRAYPSQSYSLDWPNLSWENKIVVFHDDFIARYIIDILKPNWLYYTVSKNNILWLNVCENGYKK